MSFPRSRILTDHLGSTHASGRRRRGATVVELAVVTPIFFLLVFGLVEFSRMLMIRQA